MEIYVLIIVVDRSLTIRFLEARTSRTPSIFLRLAPTWITDQHVSVVLNQSLSEFVFGLFIDILGIVGNNGLGNGGTNGINLSGDTSTFYPDADVQIGEFVLPQDQHGFEDLQAQRLRLDILNGLTIHFDQTTTLLGKRHRSRSLLPVVQKIKGK